jgi:type IV secretion system protein VirB2
MHTNHAYHPRISSVRAGTLLWAIPIAVAQAQSSPFLTGATALQTNILAWLTPIAIILVMVLGAMAMANRISWGWCLGAIFGIAIAFGAPQIVSWVRGMFGV